MNEQKKIVARQTELIQNINNELTLEYTALLRDKDVIAGYARRLDYVGNGEKIVKIKGLKAAETTLYDTGTVVRHKDYECLPEKFCKYRFSGYNSVNFFQLIRNKNRRPKACRAAVAYHAKPTRLLKHVRVQRNNQVGR